MEAEAAVGPVAWPETGDCESVKAMMHWWLPPWPRRWAPQLSPTPPQTCGTKRGGGSSFKKVAKNSTSGSLGALAVRCVRKAV